MNSQDQSETGGLSRVRRFLQKPWHEKARSFFFRWIRIFPDIPVPARLPFGGWWLARNDFLGAAIFDAGFENTERSFVERFLRPGMIVLDIGAHHGYYTLLASRKVGPRGLVLAIEPSPRERKRLRQHLRINRCKNVQVESRALGETQASAELYLIHGTETGCNSLRTPNVAQETERINVSVECLDRVLQDHRIERVDFIKLDVEGAELSVLKGASELLRTRPRPVILAEAYDIRTTPWGYRACEIIRYLSEREYRWFRLLPAGTLEAIDPSEQEYRDNFVAVPEEQIGSLDSIVAGATSSGKDRDSHQASLAS